MTFRQQRLSTGSGVVTINCAGMRVPVYWSTADNGRVAADQALAMLGWDAGLRGAGVTCINHHQAREDNRLLLSRTHTGNLGAAVGVRDDRVAAVGVDIEPAARTLRQGIERHFRHPGDAASWYESPLTAWVAKEAAFKAMSQPPLADSATYQLVQQPPVLSKLWLGELRRADGVSSGGFGCNSEEASPSTRLGIVAVTHVLLVGIAFVLGVAIRGVEPAARHGSNT